MKPSLNITHPELAKQVHPDSKYKATEVTTGSSKVLIWEGECGHKWDAKVYQRAMLGHNCPYCAGVRVLVGFNDFASRVPEALNLWNYSKNVFEPTQVTAQSSKRAWFKCAVGHEWEREIFRYYGHRKKGHTSSCPYCNGQRLLQGFNDLATTNPKLALQWHITKNNPLTPDQVMKGSGKIVWWQCEKGHEWKAQINSRSRNGCSQCGTNGSSKIEQKFLTLLQERNLNIKPGSIKLFKNEYAVKIDGIDKKKKLIFEYDGFRWHSPEQIVKRDTRKTMRLLELGYTVIRVRETSLSKDKLIFLNLTHPNLLQIEHIYYANYLNVENDVQKIINWLEGVQNF